MPNPSTSTLGLQTLSLSFTVPNRQPTNLTAEVQPNTDPARTGHHLVHPTVPLAKGRDFPTCTAKIHSPSSAGYAAIYGWIQMVREGSDPAGKWEMDLLPMTADLNMPFAWFGPEAQLFDVPFRSERKDLNWTCWSFLTYLEDALMSKKVRPVLAFEWGFDIKEGEVTIKPLKLLGCKDAWEAQRSLLEGSFQGWKFLPLDDAVIVSQRENTN